MLYLVARNTIITLTHWIECSNLIKGTLRVFLVHCKDIVKADDGKGDFSDAYVVFKVPGGKEVKSNVIKDD